MTGVPVVLPVVSSGVGGYAGSSVIGTTTVCAVVAVALTFLIPGKSGQWFHGITAEFKRGNNYYVAISL